MLRPVLTCGLSSPQPMASSPSDLPTVPHDGRARVIPFLVMIGARITHEADGVAVVALALRPDLLNNHGGGHGGVVMSLLDSAMANAALSRVDYLREDARVLLQQLKIHNTKEEQIVYAAADRYEPAHPGAPLLEAMAAARMPEDWVCALAPH